MLNCIKLRINAGDKSAGNTRDKAIADAYRNKFIIPLDFEMLDSAASYYQAGLGNRLFMKLPSTIIPELSIHQKLMPHIKLQTYP